MLRVNVGISRKVSRDFNSTGFSVNLEGEVTAPLDEPEVVIEKIREYYDLADEALQDQLERYESISAIASRDEEVTKNQVRPNQSSSQIAGGDRQSSRLASPQPANGDRRNGPSSQQPATMLKILTGWSLSQTMVRRPSTTLSSRNTPTELTRYSAGALTRMRV